MGWDFVVEFCFGLYAIRGIFGIVVAVECEFQLYLSRLFTNLQK